MEGFPPSVVFFSHPSSLVCSLQVLLIEVIHNFLKFISRYLIFFETIANGIDFLYSFSMGLQQGFNYRINSGALLYNIVLCLIIPHKTLNICYFVFLQNKTSQTKKGKKNNPLEPSK
jgi:hypothetical protein